MPNTRWINPVFLPTVCIFIHSGEVGGLPHCISSHALSCKWLQEVVINVELME